MSWLCLNLFPKSKHIQSVHLKKEKREREMERKDALLLSLKLFNPVKCLWEHFAFLFGLMDCIPNTFQF